ncbi:cytochrome P450 [Daldinia caldariorum]|uniref:cytochrome P450 n=1 Tax=Daldinia caldariorum TaxID=326644 RepID=UPI002008D3CD|nr:cytochrome P450 [Daldinia caldariorum]KAI1464315.1 cytochrome P450 [Daldinia caldariorum]
MLSFTPFLAYYLPDQLPVAYLVWIFIASFLITTLEVAPKFTKHTIVPGTPIVGRKWWLEPLFVTRYRFVFGGWYITRKAWEKYPNTVFTIVRPDSNMTVLPPRYVYELQNMHDDRLHPIEALSEDMQGKYTGMTILLGSHLSFNVIRNKLTPRLGSLLPTLAEELNYSLGVEMPPCKGKWVAVNFNVVMTRIISRLTSRTWVGFPLCRNEDWHSDNIYTTSQIFLTALILKCLPGVLHPIVGPVLPTRRKLRQGLKRVHSYLIPLIEERRRQAREGSEGYLKPEDVLQWMIDEAEGDERSAQNIATRYVFSVIGSLYTVSAGLIDCLYDLVVHPEYLEPLREEVRHVLEDDGGWQKGTPAKLIKMDSFMKESQRVNAPSPLSFKRIVKEKLTLSDGLVLPKGAYICVVNTSSLGCENDDFDGFRYSKKRQDPGFMTRHQYSSTDSSHITFGHGRFACPGRFIAAVEIKLVFATMLGRYDISFGEGRGRPRALQVLELGFPDPTQEVYVRERM